MNADRQHAVPHADRAVHRGRARCRRSRRTSRRSQHTNQLLAASGDGRARRSRTRTTGIAPATADRRPASSRCGGNLPQDAPVGAHVDRRTPTVYNNIGHARSRSSSSSPRTADGWTMQASSNGQTHRRAVDDHVRRDRRTHEHRRHALRVATSTASPARPAPGRRPASRSASARATDPEPAARWARARRTSRVLEQNGGDGQTPDRHRHRHPPHRRRPATRRSTAATSR